MTLAVMKTAVETALKAVGLEKPVTVDPAEDCVWIDETVSLSRCFIDTKGVLGGSIERLPGWLVEWWSETPSTLEEPVEVVGRDIYRGVSAYDAARKAALAFHEEALAYCFGLGDA